MAHSEDLHHASWVLEGAAGEVDEAARQLRMAAYWLEQARPDAVAGVGGIVSHTLHEVEDALHGLGGADAVQADLADAAARVAAVARAYEDAESHARAAMGSAQWWGNLGIGVLKATTLPLRVRTGVAMRLVGADRAADFLLPEFEVAVTDILNGATVGAALGAMDLSLGPLPSKYEVTAGTLAALVSLLERIAGEPRYAGVTPRIGSYREVDVPHDVHDLIADLHGIDPGGPGTIVIDTIEHPDGTRSHIVRIPGTRDNWIKDPSTLDYGSNLPAVLGEDSDTEQMVRDALAVAGILPSEPVMLAGHSQGGIIAANIAESIGEDYNITHVITAGSPTDRSSYPPEVQYLNFLHPSDIVAGTDGKPPQDLPNVTTVTGHLDQAADPGLRSADEGIGTAHHITTYMATAQAAAASQHPSMTAWRASAKDFLSGGRATRREYAPTFSDPDASQRSSANGSGTGRRDPGEISNRGARASGPRGKPWPGDLTARCEPRAPRHPAAPALPSLPEPLDELLSPTLGTVVPMPTG